MNGHAAVARSASLWPAQCVYHMQPAVNSENRPLSHSPSWPDDDRAHVVVEEAMLSHASKAKLINRAL
jgi:hypothetical protein